MNIGLFFGSFNPVHCGHLTIANYCLAYEYVQEVWFVISPQNPLKNSASLLPQEQRLQWLEDAIKNYRLPIKICSIELNMPVPSYTINTLQKIAETYIHHKFYIIMGADNLACIEQWKNWKQIIMHYKILVYPRLGVDAVTLCKQYGAQFIDAPIIEISSTMLRQAKAENRNMSAFLPYGVNFY